MQGRLRGNKFRLTGVSIGKKCILSHNIEFLNGNYAKIGNDCIIDAYVQFKCPTAVNSIRQHNIHIADNVFIGRGCVLDSNHSITIGKNTFVAPFCFITDTNHIFAEPDQSIRLQGCEYKPVTIGEDVWIGAHVVVVAGVTIGNGCIVAANSTVTRDIAPGTIVGGSPARFIKYRPGYENNAIS